MRKKRNDNSTNYEDWTTRKLKNEAISYDECIHGPAACYGSRDVMMFYGILEELSKRGIDSYQSIKFN